MSVRQSLSKQRTCREHRQPALLTQSVPRAPCIDLSDAALELRL